MRLSVWIFQFVCVAISLALLSSCVPPAPQRLQDLGTVMDAMSLKEAEFGTMSVSAPLLADPNDVFQFNIAEDSENFYQDAKTNVQGTASELQQALTNFGASANVGISPAAGAINQALLQQYLTKLAPSNPGSSTAATASAGASSAAQAAQQALLRDLSVAANLPADQQQESILRAIKQFFKLVNATETPSPPSAPAAPPSVPTFQAIAPAPSTQPTLPTDVTQVLNNSPQGLAFAAFQQLNANQTPLSITDRAALIQASGDTAVKAMFEVIGNPSLAERFRNKRVLFGVSTVSVNPGWRTSQNYAANIAIECKYKQVEARASILAEFIKNPKVPADLRLRLALDQDVPLPDDAPALAEILKNDKELRDDLDSGLWLVNSSAQHNLSSLIAYWCSAQIPPGMAHPEYLDPDAIKDQLRKAIVDPIIPDRYKPFDTVVITPLVSAVSPLNDTQTLDLASSYRQQVTAAFNLALALQLAGANAQAQFFLDYANSLQQDFSTITPDVIANSYSMGGYMYGFQVGPQFRAIGQLQAGRYSGPALILQRQSFPALIAYGFDANDLIPRVVVGSDGKYQLQEVQVLLDSSHNWLPTNRNDPILSDTERLQLSYWSHQDLDKANDAGQADGNIQIAAHLADVRRTALASELFGSELNFYLPEEIISPARRPDVYHIEPDHVELSEDEANSASSPPTTLAMALEGANLDTVDIAKIRLVSGGELCMEGENAPKLVGGVISVHVTILPSEDPKPLVFALPSPDGGTFTTPITPHSGSTPMVESMAPQIIALDADTSGNIHPTDVYVVITGHNLDLIDWGNISVAESVATPAMPPAIADATPGIPFPVGEKGRDAWVVPLHITAPVQSLGFKLPLKYRGDATYIYTPPIVVTKNKFKFTLTADSTAHATTQYSTNVKSLKAPAAPTGILTAGGIKKVYLTWQKSPDAVSYTVFFGDKQNGPFTNTAPSTQANLATVPVTGTGPYYFVVSAANSSGATASAPVKASRTVPPAKSPQLLSPTGLASASIGGFKIKLTWDPTPGAKSYDVYYWPTSIGPGDVFATAPQAPATNPAPMTQSAPTTRPAPPVYGVVEVHTTNDTIPLPHYRVPQQYAFTVVGIPDPADMPERPCGVRSAIVTDTPRLLAPPPAQTPTAAPAAGAGQMTMPSGGDSTYMEMQSSQHLNLTIESTTQPSDAVMGAALSLGASTQPATQPSGKSQNQSSQSSTAAPAPAATPTPASVSFAGSFAVSATQPAASSGSAPPAAGP